MVIELKEFSKSIMRLAALTALLLLIPLIAMQLTDEVVWTPVDFVAMGALLFGTGLAYELITRMMSGRHRVAIAVGLVVVFLVIWAELAVGIF